LVFGVGTDIIEIQRVERALERTDRLKQKIFTPGEIECCEARPRNTRHFAARFAAKEAFLKAMGTGWGAGYRFIDIEIIEDARGRPEVVVSGKVKSFCEAKGIIGCHV
jgi:holo-[acyl-carrier protein] synthase